MGLRRYIAKTVESKLGSRFSAIENRISQLEQQKLGASSELDRFAHSPNILKPSNDSRYFRETLIQSIGRKGLSLEIGPYFRPIITGPNARYFDVFDTEELRRRAEVDPDPAVNAATVPEMHYTDTNGDLSVVDETFCDIVSSHCIEHQPDLVSHLEKVYELLDPGGRYVAIVPDKRYCFDHFSPISSVGDVLEAYSERRHRHSLRSIINLYGFSTHNDPLRHWAGDHFDDGYYDALPARVKDAINMYQAAKDDYVDCHAWCFTPETFVHICDVLYRMKKIRLRLEAVGATRPNSLEFSAVFRRG